jgi:uncharacterized protein (TIGR02246 family)
MVPLRLIAAAASLGLLVGIAVPLDAQAISSATTDALDAANAAFSRAYVAGDAEAVIGSYTADAVLHPPAGGLLVGAQRVREYWGPIADRPSAGHRLEANLRRHLAPDVVLEVGRWHSQSLRDGEPQPWSTDCYTVIWRRGGDGAWRLEFDTWTGPIEADWACRPRE